MMIPNGFNMGSGKVCLRSVTLPLQMFLQVVWPRTIFPGVRLFGLGWAGLGSDRSTSSDMRLWAQAQHVTNCLVAIYIR
jgi:hypothetical protein